MLIREIITRITNTETGEVTEKSNIINGKLYGVYNVISNKTVRQNEKLFIRWRNKTKNVSGEEMVRTNRGWFIDGYHVDEKSIELWFNLTKNDRSWRPRKRK